MLTSLSIFYKYNINSNIPPTLYYCDSSILQEYVFRFESNRMFFLWVIEIFAKGAFIDGADGWELVHEQQHSNEGKGSLMSLLSHKGVFYVFV